MFKKMRGINLSYERQGFVRFCCLTYDERPREVQHRITDICLRVGKDDWHALFELMTTQEPAVNVSAKHHISVSVLYRLRQKFYYAWYDENYQPAAKLPGIGLN